MKFILRMDVSSPKDIIVNVRGIDCGLFLKLKNLYKKFIVLNAYSACNFIA
jgi:hypothetical protein